MKNLGEFKTPAIATTYAEELEQDQLGSISSTKRGEEEVEGWGPLTTLARSKHVSVSA